MKNIKIAEIVPLKFLKKTSNNVYHMCLAHLVLQNEEYAQFYRSMSDQGKYVLVDNGSCEGENMSFDGLMKVYEIIKPKEVILPDVLFNKEETLKRTRFFLEHNDLSSYKKMAVPQGKDPQEWKECCFEMLKLDIDTIGIPKWLGKDDPMTRPVLCEMLDLVTDKEIHLLGCNEGPGVVLKCRRRNPRVRGCDSAFAYLCSKAGVNKIVDVTERPDEKIDFLNDTIEKSSLCMLMTDFEIAAGAYDNGPEKGWC